MTDWGYFQHHESHAHQPIRNERGWNKRVKDTVTSNERYGGFENNKFDHTLHGKANQMCLF